MTTNCDTCGDVKECEYLQNSTRPVFICKECRDWKQLKVDEMMLDDDKFEEEKK